MYNKLRKYLPVLSLALGILVFLMIFFPAIVHDDTMILRGTEATIGTEIASLFDLGSVSVGFNFWNFLAFISPLVVVFTGFQVTKAANSLEEANTMKIMTSFLTIVAFVISLVVFLNFGETTKGVINAVVEVEYNFTWFDLGIGVILGSIFAAIGIASSAMNFLLSVKK